MVICGFNGISGNVCLGILDDQIGHFDDIVGQPKSLYTTNLLISQLHFTKVV